MRCSESAGYAPAPVDTQITLSAGPRIVVALRSVAAATRSPHQGTRLPNEQCCADSVDLWHTCGRNRCRIVVEVIATRIRNSIKLFIGCVLVSIFAMPVRADVVLTLQGSCPGPMRASVTGTIPHRTANFLFARDTGKFRIPLGPCKGIILGLSQEGLRVVAVRDTGPTGSARIQGLVPPSACGGYMQVFMNTCQTSNVVRIK